MHLTTGLHDWLWADSTVKHSGFVITQTKLFNLPHSTMVRFSVPHQIHTQEFSRIVSSNFLSMNTKHYTRNFQSFVLVWRLTNPSRRTVKWSYDSVKNTHTRYNMTLTTHAFQWEHIRLGTIYQHKQDNGTRKHFDLRAGWINRAIGCVFLNLDISHVQYRQICIRLTAKAHILEHFRAYTHTFDKALVKVVVVFPRVVLWA